MVRKIIILKHCPMARKIKYQKDDLFQRRQVRDLSLQSIGARRSVRGIHPLHAACSLLMIALGLFGVYLVMMNMVAGPWVDSLLSLAGSVTVVMGAWMLFDAVNERKSVDNLVRNAIIRSLHDKN